MQHHVIVNLDRGEYLRPTAFGEGCGLMTFATSYGSIMMALGILLARDNGKGGDDFRSTDAIVGSWAGNRIAVVGDYGPKEHPLPAHIKVDDRDEHVHDGHISLYGLCMHGSYRDVSDDIIRAIQNSRVTDSPLRHVLLGVPETGIGGMSRFDQVSAGLAKERLMDAVGAS